MPYKIPISVLVVVYTEAGEFLMLRRCHPDDFWQSVTGSLKKDETPIMAARRELFEETGIDAGEQIIDCQHQNRFPIIPPWRDRYAPEVSHNTEHLFRLKLSEPIAIELNPKEHSEFRWLPQLEAATLASSYTNRDAILELNWKSPQAI